MRLEVKICGLRDEASVNAAVKGGAQYVGFVFCKTSRQLVTPEFVSSLAPLIPTTVIKVGLFVDADDEWIRAVLKEAPLDLLQLHGHETPKRVATIKAMTGLPVMTALRLATEEDLKPVAKYEAVSDRLLFDTRLPEKTSEGRLEKIPTGGTGKSFDWTLLQGKQFKKPWMLAGGLKTTNLEQAVRITGTKAVDVSSGVEDENGTKSVTKIGEFLARAAQF